LQFCHQAFQFEVELLQLEKGGSNLCRAHRRHISFRAYDMLFDEVLVRFSLYPAVVCNGKSFIR
jgi:hypothetical protein